MSSEIRRIIFLWMVLLSISKGYSANVLKKYFAHNAVHDQYGVIAPWYDKQNGQCDFRIKVAVDTLKRYPWTDPNSGVIMPEYMLNSMWHLAQDATIKAVPLESYPMMRYEKKYPRWLSGDYGQRAYFIITALADYYRYSGDPMALAHITMQVDHMLTYTLTPSTHEWPEFPYSVPTSSASYTEYDGFIQIDIAAQQGLALLKAYQLIGDPKWFQTAKHWGDVIAENRIRNATHGTSPWQRYAVEIVAGWGKNQPMTGGVCTLVEFFDELIKLGYDGVEEEIIAARDEALGYIKNTLLPAWTKSDTFGRHYWDCANDWPSLVASDGIMKCIIAHREYFPDWQYKARSIGSLFIFSTTVNENQMADTYSGAWVYPESSKCCRRSVDYGPMQMAPVFAEYAALTGDNWTYEQARRQMLITGYHFLPDGKVEDDLLGGVIVGDLWFKIVHPQALANVMKMMAFMPEVFGPSRENHIMNSTAAVNSVNYEKGNISYSVYGAGKDTITTVRLSFIPDKILADNRVIIRHKEMLDSVGYFIRKLSNGDALVSIRHDEYKSISIYGCDPQSELPADRFVLSDEWEIEQSPELNGVRQAKTDVKGAIANISFQGNQVRIFGTVGPKGGIADVFIDGKKEDTPLDLWNPAIRKQQLVFFRSGLSNTQHEIKIVSRGSGNPIAKGNEIVINKVQYSDASGSTGYGSGGGPVGIQRFVMGCPDISGVVDSNGNRWLCGLECVARVGPTVDAPGKTWWAEPFEGQINNACDPNLYRYGIHAKEFWMNVTVGPGRYYACLKFAATRPDESASKIKILVNGRTMLDAFDVQAVAGGVNRACDIIVNDISPKNGIIELRFVGIADSREPNGDHAYVQAVEVGPNSSACKNAIVMNYSN